MTFTATSYLEKLRQRCFNADLISTGAASMLKTQHEKSLVKKKLDDEERYKHEENYEKCDSIYRPNRGCYMCIDFNLTV